MTGSFGSRAALRTGYQAYDLYRAARGLRQLLGTLADDPARGPQGRLELPEITDRASSLEPAQSLFEPQRPARDSGGIRELVGLQQPGSFL